MQSLRKGIILAGGSGKRLMPLTKSINKHLLPLYDKPMIFYPLSTLMLAGIKDILIITTKKDKERFIDLFSDGSQWGVNFTYLVEEEPLGVAQAFLIGEDFLANEPTALILGDNFFHGSEWISKLKRCQTSCGSSIFVHAVKNPSEYGVVELDKNNKIISIKEKPKIPKSNFVVTGLYFFDNTVVNRAKKCQFSSRGELEITEIINSYLIEEKLNVEFLGRGNAWLDTGSWETFYEASIFIKAIENRQGLKLGCPEEIAWRNKWISSNELNQLAEKFPDIEYKSYLKNLSKKIIN
tara:strand:+ start:18154 stop:19038 length:885 start_codon:yes stop_codon:yes gene_type:complete